MADKDDSGSPTDDSDADGSDASMSGGEKEVTKFSLTVYKIAMVSEWIRIAIECTVLTNFFQKPSKKEATSSKEASSSKPPVKKKQMKSGPDEGSQKKRPKKKKDPNAPKRAIAPFMYFSKAERAVSYL